MPNKKRQFERLCNVGRGLLCGTALLALGTLGAWTFYPETVDDFGTWWAERHIAGPQARFDAAVAILPTRTADAIKQLEKLYDDLDTVRRGDRLARLKGRVCMQLSQYFRDNLEFERAVLWAERRVELNERDLLAQVELVRALHNVSERRQESLALIKSLHEMIPESMLAGWTYANLLMHAGRSTEAVKTLFHTHDSFLDGGWRLWWERPTGNNALRRSDVLPHINGDRLRVSFGLEAGVTALRLEPPHKSTLTFHDPVLRIRYQEVQRELRLPELQIELTNMRREGHSLTSFGHSSPEFRIELPPIPPAIEPFIDFEARIERTHDSRMAAFAFRDDFPEMVKSLKQDGETEALARLLRIRGEELRLRPIVLMWRRQDESFADERRRSMKLGGAFADGVLEFEHVASVDDDFDVLRIMLPLDKGVEYRLHDLVLETDDRDRVIEITPTSILKTNDIDQRDDVWVTTGNQPFLVVKQPWRGLQVRSVRIAGGVR